MEILPDSEVTLQASAATWWHQNLIATHRANPARS